MSEKNSLYISIINVYPDGYRNRIDFTDCPYEVN
jgi:hypothetical protein